MFSIVTKNRKPQINLPIKPSSINGGPPLAQLFRHCVCVCDELPTHSIKSQLNLERFLVPTELIGRRRWQQKKHQVNVSRITISINLDGVEQEKKTTKREDDQKKHEKEVSRDQFVCGNAHETLTARMVMVHYSIPLQFAVDGCQTVRVCVCRVCQILVRVFTKRTLYYFIHHGRLIFDARHIFLLFDIFETIESEYRALKLTIVRRRSVTVTINVSSVINVERPKTKEIHT